MRKIFWDNPYQTHLMTSVVELKGNKILLAETIAYSFSGGQESDKAMINGIAVVDSTMVDNLIYYTLPDNHNLKIGDVVQLEIDWNRRYKLMRLHFAAELILEIVTQKFYLEKVGAHISENKARIDFIYDQNISTYFPEILMQFNHVIDNDYPIETGFTDEATQRRFWKITGFAQVPCGGTHVKSTAEVGYVTLKRSHPGKALERIEIFLVN